MSKRVLHCWAGKLDSVEFGSDEWAEIMRNDSGGTCMLERDHEGPHEFTPDDQIIVRFQ